MTIEFRTGRLQGTRIVVLCFLDKLSKTPRILLYSVVRTIRSVRQSTVEDILMTLWVLPTRMFLGSRRRHQ